MALEYVARMGARIRERREELGMTQRELADAIPGKADSNQVSKWERGEHKPGDNNLEHIAKALEVDPSFFMAAKPAAGVAPLLQNLSGSQLDRIEAKLDELLARTATPSETPEEIAAEAARQRRGTKRSSAASAKRRPPRDRAA